MSNGLPAMEGKTSSEIFAQHFNAHQAARKAFTESEKSFDEKSVYKHYRL